MRVLIAGWLMLAGAMLACGEAAAGSDLERQLVTIDSRGSVGEYRAVLNRLEPKCREDRRGIADLAARGRVTTKELRGVDVTLPAFLRQMDTAAPSGRRSSCHDIAVAVGLIIR